MPLTYDAGGWSWDGEALSDEEVVARRDVQIDAWAEELRQLVIDELGAGESVTAVEFPLGRIAGFATAFLSRIAEMITSSYVWARGGADAMTEADYASVAEMVEEQDDYGRGFIGALKRGELSSAQAAARTEMYAGSASKAFEMGKAVLRGAPDLPAFPGEACAGLSRCRCWWSIDETSTEWRCSWHAVGDSGTCAWCSGNSRKYAPLVIAK